MPPESAAFAAITIAEETSRIREEAERNFRNTIRTKLGDINNTFSAIADYERKIAELREGIKKAQAEIRALSFTPPGDPMRDPNA